MPDPIPKGYAPFQALRRPGGPPDYQPIYRVLIHKRELKAYKQMAERLSEETLQQLWDHLAQTPYKRPDLNAGRLLRGPEFAPLPNGTSRVFHYRPGAADRVDYRYHDAWSDGSEGDPHPVVFIQNVYRSQSGT